LSVSPSEEPRSSNEPFSGVLAICEARVSSDGKKRKYFQFIVWKQGRLDDGRVA
jgi:hypothetical protein